MLREQYESISILPDIKNPKYVKSKKSLWVGHYDPLLVSSGALFRVVLIQHTEENDFITVRYGEREMTYNSNTFWKLFKKCK